jgi:hypothetical protein
VATGLPDYIAVEIEFTPGVWTDVSEDVDAVEIAVGRAGATDTAQPGTLAFSLDNSAGTYTPDNPLSAYYPDVVEGRAVRVVVTMGVLQVTRFRGRIVALEPDFPRDPAASRTHVTAVDGLGALGRRRLQTMLREHFLGSDNGLGVTFAETLVDYFPLTDPDGSTAALSALPGGGLRRLTPQGGAPSWGNATGIASDGSSNVTLAAGTRLRGSASAFELEQVGIWFSCPPGAYGTVWNASGVGGTVRVSVGSDGYLRLYRVLSTGVVDLPGTTALGTKVDDGGVHYLHWYDGGFPAPIHSLDLDGVNIFTDVPTESRPIVSAFTVGPPTVGEMSFGHLFVVKRTTNSIPTAALGVDVYGIAKPSAGTLDQDELLAYLSQWVGVTVDTQSSSTRTITAIPTEGMSALDFAQIIANNETGRLWHDYETDEIVLESAVNAHESTPSLTVDAEDDLVGGIEMARTAAPLVRSVTVRNGAVEVTVDDATTDTDATAGVDVTAASPVELEAIATTRIALGKYQRLRPARFTVDLATAINDLYADVFGLTPGRRVRISGLPPTYFGVTHMDGYVEGWVERAGIDGYAVTFDLSAADAPPASLFDTARFAFGPGVATCSAIDADDTSVTVTWTGTSTLSTDSGDYPMDLDINGERVTVSTAPSGSTSPQTLTLSARGVAPTVARAHESGEPVEVWDAGRFTARSSFADGGVG